ncbi:hypothetical protein KAJ61_05285 [Candidatus Parcubacteria bacterium]|nr:hypothetical protein [Candidatus Parcubacteria bacterium]
MKNFKRILGVSIFLLMLTPFAVFGSSEMQKGSPSPDLTSIPEPVSMPGIVEKQTENKTMLKNQGEEQQNAVQLQQDAQAGQKAINMNLQDGQANGQAKAIGRNNSNDKAGQRRSVVANATKEMFGIAERNQGIGQQIRTIAQTQNKNQEQIEDEMNQVKNRGRLNKFFFGPDYKNLNSVEDRLANHDEKMEQLKMLAAQIADEADAAKLLEQVEVMEQVKIELAKEVVSESKGFSLFGWLNKTLVK